MNANVTKDWDGTYDGNFAHVLQSDEQCAVTYEAEGRSNGRVEIVRTVTRRARNRKDQVILWQEVVAAMDWLSAGAMLQELGRAMVIANETSRR